MQYEVANNFRVSNNAGPALRRGCPLSWLFGGNWNPRLRHIHSACDSPARLGTTPFFLGNSHSLSHCPTAALVPSFPVTSFASNLLIPYLRFIIPQLFVLAAPPHVNASLATTTTCATSCPFPSSASSAVPIRSESPGSTSTSDLLPLLIACAARATAKSSAQPSVSPSPSSLL